MGLLSLIIKMGMDATGVDVGLRRAESSVSKFSRSVNSNLKAQIAGAIGTGAILALAKASVDYASKINDVSTQLGIGTDKIQEFAFAAKQTGGDLDSMANAIRKLGESRQQALNDPAGKVAESFAKLGISAEALKSARLEDLFMRVGKSIQDAKNPQDALTTGFMLLGKGALPVIGAMREGMSELGEQAKSLGLVLEDSAIQALDDLGDKLDQLKSTALVSFGKELATLVGWVDTLMSSMKAGLAGAASYWGAVSGGASDDEAKKIGNQAFREVVDQTVQRDQARENSKAARKRIATDALIFSADTPAATAGKVSGVQKSSLNSLQQIGAFTGNDPVLRELQSSHVTAKKTEANTRKALEKTSGQSLEGFA
jgi:hypothetical protein